MNSATEKKPVEELLGDDVGEKMEVDMRKTAAA